MNKKALAEVVNVCAKLGYIVNQKKIEQDLLNGVFSWGCRLWEEPCNCGDRCRHNNGGNYHRRLELWKIRGGFAIIDTNSREDFDRDEYAGVIVFDNAKWARVADDHEKKTFVINDSRDRVKAVVLFNGCSEIAY